MKKRQTCSEETEGVIGAVVKVCNMWYVYDISLSNFYMPYSVGSLVFSAKPKAECKFTLLPCCFYILENNCLVRVAYFPKINYHTKFTLSGTTVAPTS